MSWAAVIIGGATLIGGAVKTASANKQKKKAQAKLENLQTPQTASSATIEDYYRKASANPYESAMYKMNQQNIERGTTQGLSGFQDRRSGNAGITSLIRAQNDAQLRNGAMAEDTQNRRLSDAVRLKSGDDQRVFNVNKLMPYDKLSSMYSAQASGYGQQENAGWQSIYGGANTAGMGLDQYFQSRK